MQKPNPDLTPVPGILEISDEIHIYTMDGVSATKISVLIKIKRRHLL